MTSPSSAKPPPETFSVSTGLPSLARNLAILAVGEALTRAVTFVAWVRLARILGPSPTGTVEACFAVLMILTLLVEAGVSVIAQRECARDPSVIPTTLSRAVSTQLTLALACYLLLVLIVWILPLGTTPRRLLLSIGLVLFSIPFTLNWLFQSQGRMLWRAVPQTLRYSVFLLLTVAFVHGPEDIGAVSWAEVAGASGAAVLSVWVWRKRSRPRLGVIPFHVDRTLLRTGTPVVLSHLMSIVLIFVPPIVLAAVVASEDAAFFSVPMRIVAVLLAATDVYLLNLFPTMSRAADQPVEKLRPLLWRSFHVSFWPALLFAAALLPGGQWLMGLVYGPEYQTERCLTILRILGFLVPLYVLRCHFQNALYVLGRQREALRASLVAGVALLLAIVPLSRGFGSVGAAWTSLAAATLAMVVHGAFLAPLLRKSR